MVLPPMRVAAMPVDAQVTYGIDRVVNRLWR